MIRPYEYLFETCDIAILETHFRWTCLYNGSGLRVKKVTSTETTVFVYDASSKLIAEYSTEISQTPQVSYLTTDQLGSPRVITNENGAVTSRKDFSAYGEEMITAQRTTGLKYQPPEIRQDYTGYEKDNESGLEFAQARYYNPRHGRFTSVDPLTASASIRNPQTFNRYSYVLNSPYKFTDPLGLLSSSTGACGNGCPGSDGGGGSFGGSGYQDVWSNFLTENEIVTVALNIVYDSAQFSLEAAKTLVAGTVTDLQDTFDAINVQFEISFTAGSADVAPKDHEECGSCAYRIIKGAVNGSINVFLHNNNKYTSPISQFIPESTHIFLESVPGTAFQDKLAVEVGHLFRFFVNGNPRTGQQNSSR